jgi:hypothetical protein
MTEEEIQILKAENESNKDKADLFKANYEAYKDMYDQMTHLIEELKEENEFNKKLAEIYKSYCEAYSDIHMKFVGLIGEIDEKSKDNSELSTFCMLNVHIPMRKILNETDHKTDQLDLKLIETLSDFHKDDEAYQKKLEGIVDKLIDLHNELKDNNTEFKDTANEYIDFLNSTNQTEE